MLHFISILKVEAVENIFLLNPTSLVDSTGPEPSRSACSGQHHVGAILDLQNLLVYKDYRHHHHHHPLLPQVILMHSHRNTELDDSEDI